MSFPIDWSGAPSDDPGNPFFPDVPGWTKVISSAPGSIVDTTDFAIFHPDSDVLIPWTNPQYAAANDGTHSASSSSEWDSDPPPAPPYYRSYTHALYASEWGFAIPAGATIRAVLVSINGVLYDLANSGLFPPGPPALFSPFALRVDDDWQYMGPSGAPYVPYGLNTMRTGQKYSDGSWFGDPVSVGTLAENFTDPASTYPPASGGILPFIGPSGITLSVGQVNDSHFGIGFAMFLNFLG